MSSQRGTGFELAERRSGMNTSPTERSTTLTVKGLSMSFGATLALSELTTEFECGRVHGLIGENGSGKSTFVKILAGDLHPDRGTVHMDGSDLVPHTGDSAKRVACIYQDGSLIEELTVAQNLDLLVSDDSVTSQPDWRRHLLDDFGVGDVALTDLIGDVPKSSQRLIEAAGVLAGNPDIVLFDESTSALDERGVAILLERMRFLAARGACVIFVTHRLHEVLAVTSEIKVLRDGHLVQVVSTEVATPQQLVDHMAGRDVPPYSRKAIAAVDRKDVLHATRLGGARFGPVDLTVRRGEIIGIGGAAGNGQSELIRALAGQGVESGQVSVNDRRVNSLASGVAAGAVFVSSDRRSESLSAQLSIRENVTLSLAATQLRWWRWLSQRRETRVVAAMARRFGVVAQSMEQPASHLSGGNQQKVALGRAIERNPSVLLIEEPTEGVDVRARYEIYRALEQAAKQGSAIVFTSSDASELRVLADRVVVLARGREVARLHAEDVTEQAIVHAFSTATSAANEREPAEPVSTRSTGLVRMWRAVQSRAWAANLAILVSVIVALAIFASAGYDGFASVSNISSILTLCVPLALVAVAQMSVLLVGEIDASLGAVMGLVVVILSFFPHLPLVLMALIALGVGGLLGALNGLLVVAARVSAVIATIATLGVFTGIALLLRPTPAGLVNIDLQTVVRASIGWLPWTFIGVLVICVAADLWITYTRRGLSSRATGYSAERARRLGVRADRNRALAYVAAGAIAGFGGFWLAGLTGVGDASVGSGYTLLSFAVPVIGGTLLSGGRASAIGCLAGAVFIAEVQDFVPFVSLPSGAYLVAIGALTLATLVLATIRGRRRSAFP